MLTNIVILKSYLRSILEQTNITFKPNTPRQIRNRKIRFFFEKLCFITLKNPKKVPIIINNFNRLTTLKALIQSLESRGYYNIYIIDNKSTYPPLLAYYKTINYKVFRLKKNVGFRSLWKTNIWYRFMFKYHVYTDSDVVLVDQCPDNFMEILYTLLKKYDTVFKVGLSLKIDDLPAYYSHKQQVIEWEQQFYKIKHDAISFKAPVDTTLALYRPFTRKGVVNGTQLMLRTDFPYQLKHLPWYVDLNFLDEEERYYIKETTQSTHWTQKNQTN